MLKPKKLHTMKNLILIIGLGLGLMSCKTSGDITAAEAKDMVISYLQTNPMYETTQFNTSKMRLRSDKDSAQIHQIQALENEGLVEVVDEKSRKKWFSSDSVFVLTPVLTKKALPYVIKQGNNKTEVVTIKYILDENQEVSFNQKTERRATFHVILLKDKTPFYAFGKDSNPNSDFITKEFKAKYDQEKGWSLVN